MLLLLSCEGPCDGPDDRELFVEAERAAEDMVREHAFSEIKSKNVHIFGSEWLPDGEQVVLTRVCSSSSSGTHFGREGWATLAVGASAPVLIEDVAVDFTWDGVEATFRQLWARVEGPYAAVIGALGEGLAEDEDVAITVEVFDTGVTITANGEMEPAILTPWPG